MRRIRSEGTGPERRLVATLRKRGFQFLTNDHSVEGVPDVTFKREKIAVFVDSDFWHFRPGHFVVPKSHKDYWLNKIKRNRARDRYVTEHLEMGGWVVVRLWVSEIEADPEAAVSRIEAFLKRVVRSRARTGRRPLRGTERPVRGCR